jgi:hypothetical protein
MTNISPVANPTTSGTGLQFSSDHSSITTELEAQKRSQSKGQDELDVRTGEGLRQVEFIPISARPRTRGVPDRVLLDRANDVLDNIESSDPATMSLSLESLRYVTCELWTSVANCSQVHQSILTLIESLLTSMESVSRSQAAALRGAFKDLGGPALTESHLDVLQSQFIDEGYNPLAAFSSMEDGNGSGDDSSS